MPCNSCDICYLIDQDCLCKYTFLDGFELEELSDVFVMAKNYVKDVTICDLCEEYGEQEYKYQAVIDSEIWKTYYGKVLEYYFTIIRGDGKPTKSGWVKNTGDEYSQFSTFGQKEIQAKADRIQGMIKSLEPGFLDYFRSLHPECKKESSTSEKSTDCNQGCTSCKNGTNCGKCSRKKRLGKQFHNNMAVI